MERMRDRVVIVRGMALVCSVVIALAVSACGSSGSNVSSSTSVADAAEQRSDDVPAIRTAAAATRDSSTCVVELEMVNPRDGSVTDRLEYLAPDSYRLVSPVGEGSVPLLVVDGQSYTPVPDGSGDYFPGVPVVMEPEFLTLLDDLQTTESASERSEGLYDVTLSSGRELVVRVDGGRVVEITIELGPEASGTYAYSAFDQPVQIDPPVVSPDVIGQ